MPHNPTPLLPTTKPALLLQGILKIRTGQMTEVDGHKTVIETPREIKDSLKVAPIQLISSKILIRLETAPIASFLQLKPMELPNNKEIRGLAIVKVTIGVQKDQKVAFRTRVKQGRDRKEAGVASKKEESRTTADKRVTGLKIQIMKNRTPTVRMDQAEEAMMTRTMEIEEVATTPIRTEEDLTMKTKTEIRDTATPEINKEEATMMTMRTKSQEAVDLPGDNMTMMRKMRIDLGQAEETKEMTLNKKEEVAVPAIETMMMKRNSQEEDPQGDLKTMMRRILTTEGQAADVKTAEAEMMMTEKGMVGPAAEAVAQAGNAPISGIMIEIN